MKNDYQSKLEAKKTLKRYAFTVLCSLPILILVGFLLLGKINRITRIFLFTVILLAMVLIEEYIYAKIKMKKQSNTQNEKPKHEDVFRK